VSLRPGRNLAPFVWRLDPSAKTSGTSHRLPGHGVDDLLNAIAAKLPPSWQWLARRRLWLAVVWMAAVAGLIQRLDHSRSEFANRRTFTPDQLRPTGGRGHLQVDFGGQWLMGRMVAQGHGQQLYNRNVQWTIVRAGYPRSDEPPYLRDGVFPAHMFPGPGPDDQTDHDAESLMYWIMGQDSPAWKRMGEALVVPLASANPWPALAGMPAWQTIDEGIVREATAPAVGGPLYPPILGVLYTPLGWFDRPHQAYALLQVILLLAIVVAGKGIAYLTRNRIWWPLAILVLLLFPGCRSGMDLAQNAAFSACVLSWGWALIARGKETAGGAVLGLFAFKPVWALAFFLAPVLLRKWRAAQAMAMVGLLQIGITLPVVGVHSWRDWLTVGQEASEFYKINKNWIELSRDVGGVVRRPLVDFSKPETERSNPHVDRLAWIAMMAIVAATAVIVLTARDRRATGPLAAFLLFGCYLGCFKFMYYDAMLASVPFAVLFADLTWCQRRGEEAIGFPWRVFRSIPFLIFIALLVCENVISTWDMKGRIPVPFLNSIRPNGLEWEIGFRCAWDTLLIIAAWLWLGLRIVFDRLFSSPKAFERGTDIGLAHQ
jgi:arabinofuranan 3-O-arabinosyltransferase